MITKRALNSIQDSRLDTIKSNHVYFIDIIPLTEFFYLFLIVHLESEILINHHFQIKPFKTKDIIEILSWALINKQQSSKIFFHPDNSYLFTSGVFTRFTNINNIDLSLINQPSSKVICRKLAFEKIHESVKVFIRKTMVQSLLQQNGNLKDRRSATRYQPSGYLEN